MPLVLTFRVLSPVVEKAFDVFSTAYDVLNTVEACERVEGHPLRFLTQSSGTGLVTFLLFVEVVFEFGVRLL